MFTLQEELNLLGFDDKELNKFYSFHDLVRSQVKGKFEQVIDLCAGNGLGGFLFNYYWFAEKSILVDIKKPKRFSKIAGLFKKYEMNFEYLEHDVNKLSIKEIAQARNSFIIGIHTCGSLSDRILQVAVENNIPFALMPCCHENDFRAYRLQSPPDPRFLMYPDKADYFNLVRLQYAREKGYSCDILEISRKITPKNKVLIGVK